MYSNSDRVGREHVLELCRVRDTGAVQVRFVVNTQAMPEHRAEMSATVPSGIHTIGLMNQAA